MTTAPRPTPNNAACWDMDLEELYSQWETDQTYEAEVKLFDAIEEVFRNRVTNDALSPQLMDSANKALDWMMADVANQKDSFAVSNEIRVINDLVEFGLWQRYAENPHTALLLAYLCVAYAEVLDSPYRISSSFPVLDALLSGWTGQPFVSRPGTIVNDVKTALFGPTWVLLCGDELQAGSDIYPELLRLQPSFVFTPAAVLPVVTLPCDWE